MELQNIPTEYWTTVVSQRMLLFFFIYIITYISIFMYLSLCKFCIYKVTW